MIDQLQLPLEKRKPNVAADPKDIELLCEWLIGRGWVRAVAIEAFFPLWKANDHRYIRAIASQSAGRILSFPGSPGYRIALEASIDELWHARNVFDRAGIEAAARKKEIDAVIHRRKP
ncbi:MAG TPA: hypothetical protein VHY22_05440 [Chthoniobacteraceae bacterium]|jgi:hypothetical protein|nr:hypothetical protein [Chthoniobacteraceae bacterium]